jgi:hypothetical protein
VTDHDAMRAARDRWLADPESAGTGKAFEAGWSARTQPLLALNPDRPPWHAGLCVDCRRPAELADPNPLFPDNPLYRLRCAVCRETARERGEEPPCPPE